MNTTLTSKGQLTLPKAARDALALKVGTRLTVQITKNGALTLTPVAVAPLKLYGVLKSPLKRAPTLKEMKSAVSDAVAQEDRRISAEWHAAQKLCKPRRPRKVRK